MKKSFGWFGGVACLVLFSTFGCGKRAGWHREPLDTGRTAELLMFSAPWCTVCNHEIPEVHYLVNSDAADIAKRVKVTIYVVSDIDKRPPTKAVVEEYARILYETEGVDFPMTMDPWMYATYRKYFKWTGGGVPGAVVLDDTGAITKKFEPGQDFDAQDILEAVKDAMLPAEAK